MGIKYDKDKLSDTVGYLNSALSNGIDFIRAMLVGAKRENQLSNSERAMLDDILIKLQMHEIDLTELKRTKERKLKELCK